MGQTAQCLELLKCRSNMYAAVGLPGTTATYFSGGSGSASPGPGNGSSWANPPQQGSANDSVGTKQPTNPAAPAPPAQPPSNAVPGSHVNPNQPLPQQARMGRRR